MGKDKRVEIRWDWHVFTFGIAWLKMWSFKLDIILSLGFIKVFIGFGKRIED